MDAPLHPLSIALGSEATFVARSVDTHTKHLGAVLRRAAEHRGTALVEIYQNCNVYNDGAFEYAKDVKLRSDTLVELEHGQPIVFGANRDKGIRLSGLTPEAVSLGNGLSAADLLVHDETANEPTLATILARMRHPALPEAVGVLRAIERPTFDALVNEQVEATRAPRGQRQSCRPAQGRRYLDGGLSFTRSVRLRSRGPVIRLAVERESLTLVRFETVSGSRRPRGSRHSQRVRAGRGGACLSPCASCVISRRWSRTARSRGRPRAYSSRNPLFRFKSASSKTPSAHRCSSARAAGFH